MIIILEAKGSVKEFAPSLPDGIIFISGRPRMCKGKCGNLWYAEFNYSDIASHFFVVLKRSSKNNWMCDTNEVNTDNKCRLLFSFYFFSSRFQRLTLKLCTNYNNYNNDNNNFHLLTAPESQTSCRICIISNQLTVLQGRCYFHLWLSEA